ncbi:MAG: hypothetical protein ACRDHY_07095 [Anaerolineales bacterium]
MRGDWLRPGKAADFLIENGVEVIWEADSGSFADTVGGRFS